MPISELVGGSSDYLNRDVFDFVLAHDGVCDRNGGDQCMLDLERRTSRRLAAR